MAKCLLTGIEQTDYPTPDDFDDIDDDICDECGEFIEECICEPDEEDEDVDDED